MAALLNSLVITNKLTSGGRCHPLQFGFTKDRSPLHAAFLLTEVIAESTDNEMPPFVTSLDVEKAFDMVQHNSLHEKLHLAYRESGGALRGTPTRAWHHAQCG